MSKKGSSYGTCGQRGKKACGARNGKVREGILSVLAYTLACESEKAHLRVSERARTHVYERSTAQGNTRGGSGP